MMTIVGMAADALGQMLAEDFRRKFGSAHGDQAERLDSIARVALECLGRSDALYHTVEHTFMVTLVGRDILHGRMLSERIERMTTCTSSWPVCCTTSATFGAR